MVTFAAPREQDYIMGDVLVQLMKGSVGVIFGETGSVQFKFAVTDPSEVKRTDYVKVWHSSDGWVLGQVMAMTRSSAPHCLFRPPAALPAGIPRPPQKLAGSPERAMGLRWR